MAASAPTATAAAGGQQQQQHAPAANLPVIRRLDESVVNRIAAGEVIQRPSSALKELLENSLDAGATQITVVVKEGGCKLLQISDNGHGIRKADLPLLCQRHTTSKLSAFEDLETISTLGFRGEALCSISFVSNMTVTTMTANQLHGWRASYKDSEMVVPPGAKPVASVPGTTITVEDLFYNVPTRRKALKSAAEEYARVLDVVSRYAVCKAGVAFCCKRHGESRPDVSTLAGSSRLDNVRAVYGAAVAKELLPLQCQVGEEPSAHMGVDAPCSFTLEGYASSANYAAKSSTFILFINERLVEWPALRKAMEATYAAVLPKSGRPFLLLFMRLPPRHVEVNMHPTKREVGVLNQEEVIEAVRGRLEALLSQSNTTRTFATQQQTQTQQQQQQAALLPALRQTTLTGVQQQPLTQAQRRRSLTQGPAGGDQGEEEEDEEEGEDEDLGAGRASGGSLGARGSLGSAGAGGGGGGGAAQPYRPNKLVRVDGRAQSMETFLSSQYAAPHAAALAGSISRKRRAPGGGGAQLPGTFPGDAADPLAAGGDDDDEGAGGGAGGGGGAPLGVCTELDSVRQLAAEVEAATHEGLCALLRDHVLVGMFKSVRADIALAGCVRALLQADDVHALVQHQTRLYLVNVRNLSQDLFYQQVLRCWERRPPQLVRLDPPPSVSDLMALALTLEAAAGTWQDGEEDESSSQGTREGVCALAQELVLEKAPMLRDYLGLQVDTQGRLVSLPQLVPGHVPDLGYLPDLVLALGKHVEWDEELPCFRSLAQVLADFYALRAPQMPVWAGQQQQQQQQPQEAQAGVGGGGAEAQAQAVAREGDAPMADAGGGTLQQPAVEAEDVEMAVEGGEAMECAMAAAAEGAGPPPPRAGGGEGGQGGALAWRGPGPPGDAQPQERAGLGGEASAADGGGVAPTEDEQGARAWMIKQVLFPAFRSLLRPGKHRAKDGTVVLVTSLEKLYRVFERC